jgi:hypothetical protein
MTKFKSGLLAAAAIGALSVVTAGQANATVYALSLTNVRNLTLSVVDEEGEGDGQAFGGLFDFNASNSAALVPGGSETNSDDADAPFSVDRGINLGADAGPVDPLQAFITNNGESEPGENDFTAKGPTSPGNYARADHILSDTLINTAGEGSGDAGFGGDWDSIAEASVNGSTIGDGIVGKNDQTWNFATVDFETDVEVTIEFDMNNEQIAELIGNEAAGAAATSHIDLTFSFQDLDGEDDVNLSFVRDITADEGTPLQTRGDLTAPIGCSRTAEDGDGFRHYSCTFAVQAGEFLFKITQANTVTVEADTQSVPEPMTLGLVGAGLLGLGAAARRRRSIAA